LKVRCTHLLRKGHWRYSQAAMLVWLHHLAMQDAFHDEIL
jgi:hypothetical protein